MTSVFVFSSRTKRPKSFCKSSGDIPLPESITATSTVFFSYSSLNATLTQPESVYLIALSIRF